MDVVGALIVIGWVGVKGTDVGCRARTGDQGRECGKGEKVVSRGAGTPTPPFARVWDPTPVECLSSSPPHRLVCIPKTLPASLDSFLFFPFLAA